MDCCPRTGSARFAEESLQVREFPCIPHRHQGAFATDVARMAPLALCTEQVFEVAAGGGNDDQGPGDRADEPESIRRPRIGLLAQVQCCTAAWQQNLSPKNTIPSMKVWSPDGSPVGNLN